MTVTDPGQIVDVSAASVESTPAPVAAVTETVSPSSTSTPASNTPVNTEVVSAAAPSTPVSDEWREHIAKSYGIDAKTFASPSQAIDYSMQAYIKAAQDQQRLQSDYQQRLAAYEQQLAVYQNLAGQRATPEPTPAESVPGKWSPPEYNRDWSRFLQMNPQTGLYEAIEGVNIDPEIVTKANARADWERKWQAEFAENPGEFTYKQLEHKFKEVEENAFNRAKEYFEGLRQQEQLNQAINGTVQSHSDWLYQKNAMGGIGRDAYGTPLLTEKGAKYVSAVETLLKAGVTDPTTQDQLALALIGHSDQPEVTPASRAAEYAGQPAARNLAEALHTSNRNGSNQPVVAGAVETTATPGSFLAMAAGPMREQGIALTSGTITPI